MPCRFFNMAQTRPTSQSVWYALVDTSTTSKPVCPEDLGQLIYQSIVKGRAVIRPGGSTTMFRLAATKGLSQCRTRHPTHVFWLQLDNSWSTMVPQSPDTLMIGLHSRSLPTIGPICSTNIISSVNTPLSLNRSRMVSMLVYPLSIELTAHLITHLYVHTRPPFKPSSEKSSTKGSILDHSRNSRSGHCWVPFKHHH